MTQNEKLEGINRNRVRHGHRPLIPEEFVPEWSPEIESKAEHTRRLIAAKQVEIAENERWTEETGIPTGLGRHNARARANGERLLTAVEWVSAVYEEGTGETPDEHRARQLRAQAITKSLGAAFTNHQPH